MRRIISSGSVKAFSLNRAKVLEALKEAAREACLLYPDIREIRLIGSLAREEHTGLSDVDLFIKVESSEENPLERMKPYFSFFADKIPLSVDIIVAASGEEEQYAGFLKGSVLLAECAATLPKI